MQTSAIVEIFSFASLECFFPRNDQVVVELKATEQKNRLFGRQLKTYLVLMKRHLGLLLNFGQTRMVDGIERVVNGYEQ